MSNKGPSLSDNKGPAANLVKKIFSLCYISFDLLTQAVFETDPKLDHAPIVRHVALSSIEFGHKKTIADIQWVPNHIEVKTRHTHSVNASCSYEVHENIICMHTNGSLEDVALL